MSGDPEHVVNPINAVTLPVCSCGWFPRGDLTMADHLAGVATGNARGMERARGARLARWQQGTGNERDGVGRSRQTAATRAQDARSAPGSHNSSPA